MDPALSVFWTVYGAALRVLAALWVMAMVIFIGDCLRSWHSLDKVQPKEADSSSEVEEPLYRLMRPADFRVELSKLEESRRIHFSETERLALYSVAITAGLEQAERAAEAEARP